MPAIAYCVPIRGPRCAALLALALCAAAAPAQKTGLAFWAPPASADADFRRMPKNDQGRYAALHQAFVEAQCTGSRMQQQPAGAHGEGNLVCTLPRTSPHFILVAARFDEHADAGKHSAWSDGWILPLLYHALQAQPRRHTFVFAALNGDEGEDRFFNSLSAAPPQSVIVLDGLGFGPPVWFAFPFKPNATPENPWGTNGLLGSVASAICRVTKTPDPAPLDRTRFVFASDFSRAQEWRDHRMQSTLIRRGGAFPELLLYTGKTDECRSGSVSQGSGLCGLAALFPRRKA